tara:strand:+ start:6067 stop:6519 length:453 start_codon:yes stop_codon:yes gene_type:complete
MNTVLTKPKKELKKKKISLLEIHRTVKFVIDFEFNVPKFYRNIFVYKIYCKLAYLYTSFNKKKIALGGGFTGKDYSLSVNNAMKKYDSYYKHDQLFQEIAKACKGRLHDSNTIEETYAETAREQINFICSNFTDDKLQNVINYLMREHNG